MINSSAWWFRLGLGVVGSLVLTYIVYARNTPLSFDRRDLQIGGFAVAITAGDFNGDGHLDLATANSEDDSVSILLGQDDGTFGASQDFEAGDFSVSVTTGDFNGDGVLDLATANNNVNSVSVL